MMKKAQIKTSRKPHRCNTFPTVWAAIFGCEGMTRRWRYHLGEVEWVCETCEAAKDRADSLPGQAHQDFLRAAQDAAGVADYRTAPAAWVNGRPALV